MDSQPSVGLAVVGLGLVIIVIGLLIWAGGLSWFGRLPGDIRIEREHVRVYIPIVSMLLVSVVLSVIAGVVGRLFRR
jgi:hypothetical protein